MSPAVFAHGHLRLYLLSLLAERPMHGYELIQALSDRFGGTYVPSAGTIYPRLGKLEEDGLVTKESDGRKTVYEITEAGRRELADREGELDGIESELSDSVRRLADEVRASVDDAMRTLRADLAAAARDARSEARAGAHDLRAEARVRQNDLEMALNEFRSEIRAELRGRVAAGALAPETVELVRSRLAEVRREILAALRGS